MVDIDEIDDEKALLEAADGADHIYIYGAGFVGKMCFKRLIDYGIDRQRIGFVVSETGENRTFFGCPIDTVSEITAVEDGVILIAVTEKYHDEIKRILAKNGCRLPVITIDGSLQKDLERGYMESHRLKEDAGDIDVLLMSSDNYRTSGAFLCAATMCEEMNRLGVRMVMLLPEYGNGEELLEDKGIPYAYFPLKNWCKRIGDKKVTLPDQDDAIKELSELIEKHHVRLVHNNTTYTYAGAAAAKKCGIPYVWHIREDVWDQGMDFIDRGYAAELMGDAKRIICVSDFIQSCYEFLPIEKKQVVYDGISIPKKVTSPTYLKQKLILENDRLRIVNVGVLYALKGQEDIVEAAVILKESNIDFNVSFVGDADSDYLERLKEIVRENGLEEYVEFIGSVKDVWEYLDQADIAVISSRAEPFGRCTVEALLGGCLTIGAKAGATPELIKDGVSGLLYEPGNAKELAELIIWTIDHKEEAREMAIRGAKGARQFSSIKNTERIWKIYEEAGF